MNARKVLLILGGIVAALVIAIVALSLFTIQKMEREKNVKRTEKARAARHARAEETPESNLTVNSDGIVEQPKQENDEDSETKTEQTG